MKAIGALSAPVHDLNLQKGPLYKQLRRLGIAARLVVPVEAPLYAVSTHLRPGHKAKKGAGKTSALSPKA